MRQSLRFHASRWVLASAFMISVAPAFAVPSLAQSVQEERQVVALPAAPLEDAISAVARVFKIDILVSSDLVAGQTAPEISGQLSAEEAITEVLRGSGLSVRRSPSGGYIIEIKTAQRRTKPTRAVRPVVADTIIVTGTKQNLSIQDTQASVAIVTDELIDAQAIFELSDIFLRTANVTQTNGPFSFSIRGVSSGGVGGAGVGRTANFYLDNAPISLNGLSSAFNLWDISQVEILRGPQSTTQGRNALAGAVVMQSADPEYDFGVKLRALIGNNKTRQYSGAVTGPIIEDQIAFRIAADYREQDFQTLNGVTGAPEGASDATTLRAKLLFEPSVIPNLRLEVSYQYVDFFTSGDGSGVIRPDPESEDAIGFDPFDRVNFDFRGGVVENENHRFLADLFYEFSQNWSAQIIATYDDTERFIDNVTGPDLRLEETFTVDGRGIFSYDRFSGWFGGYYFRDDLASSTDQAFNVAGFGGTITPAGTDVLFIQSRSAETENYAFYGDVTFALTDRISLNFGARYDNEKVTDTGFASQLFVDLPPGTPCTISAFFGTGPCDVVLGLTGVADGDPLAGTAPYDAFLPRGGIIFDIDEDKSISFVVQRGYRAGGFFIRSESTSTGLSREVVSFDEEYLTNYEIAWRSVWLDDRLTFNANAFYSTWSDQQVRIQEPGSLEPEIRNAGSSELYGLEIETAFNVTSSLDVYGSLGLVHTEFTDFPFAVDDNGDPVNPANLTFANLAGNEFGSAPNVTASVGVVYDNDTGVYGSANISYRGDQFSDVTNLDVNRTGSYAIVNARVGYKTDIWRVSVFVDNLFNDEFLRTNVLQEVDPDTGLVDDANIGRNNISQPRHFGVEVEATF
ncbi:MAG: TonB-dependent receptor domain-containing protein [Sphingomonadales bacterium]